MATLYDSKANPVKFHRLDNLQLPNYVSRFMWEWAFRRTIQPWEQKVCFNQPWSVHDSIRLQYTSDAGPIVIRVYDSEGVLLNTLPMTQMHQDELQPTFFIYQISIPLAPYNFGKFFLTRDVAGNITYSEPMEIIDIEDSGIDLENQDPTLLIEYSHYEPKAGLKFFTPFAPMIRVPGIIQYNNTGAKDVIYEDQPLNMTLVTSQEFDVHNFILGGNYGVPPYFASKVFRCISMSNSSFNGRLMTKNGENIQFEPTELTDYPMKGFKIEMREKLNRDSVIMEDETVIVGTHSAAIMMDAKGFGLDPGDGNFQQIISVE